MKQGFRRASGIAALLAVLLISASSAQADPLLVTGGQFTWSWDGFYSFQLSGENFSFVGGGRGGGQTALNAPIGATVDLSGLGSLYSGHFGFFPSSATLNGVSYFPITTEGMLSLSAVPFVVASEADVISFSTPFTMTGWIRGYSGYPDKGAPLFDFSLAGSGIADIGPLRDTGGGQYILNAGGRVFRFQRPVKPVPEPATLLLVSTGVAGFLIRRRSRHTRSPAL